MSEDLSLAYQRALEVWPSRDAVSTGDAISEIENAVQALTSIEKVLVHDEYMNNGAQYESSDFRDHPKLDEHMAVLEREWGDEEHPSHRTLEILRLLVARRCELATEIDRRVDAGGSFDERYVGSEAVWRRIGDQDIFILGFTHQGDYLEHHRSFYDGLSQHSAAFVLEGLQTARLGYSLDVYWSMPNETVYGRLMRNTLEVNPDLLFVENDPRDESHVVLDELYAQYPCLPDDLLDQWYGHLTKWTPSVAAQLESPQGLRMLTRLYAHDNLTRVLSPQRQLITRGVHYGPFPHFDVKEGAFVPSEISTGFNLGGLSFRDAQTAFSLRKFVDHARDGRVSLNGPIIDLQGAQHVHQKVAFWDDPRSAIVNVIQQPHFRFLPDDGRVFAEAPIDLPTNLAMIQRQLDLGVFSIDPLSSNAPDDLYTASGFVMARVVDGGLRYESLS